ncbi:ABC transporter substrate-binding protein [Streptomonospora litoralis]|uniref:Glycine betaine-binding protein OpuAC n=1 Tax=Streptomonospora litoralis TaxID=2498135 RepID=A0A4P6PZJ7_9ACTN|nr:ABC transporter substrate-binding protein [Streptomonospora litoralis]QBI53625.1 Glycine betaine-binding protein OpuAC precursor [Streptomonospora litoralis]
MVSLQRPAASASIVALTMLMAASCGSPSEGGFDSGGGTDTEVVLVEQPWEDLMVENRIARQVLKEAGYSVEIEDLSVPLGAQALTKGDADAYLGNWWPSQKEVYGDPIDAGKIEVLGTVVTGVAYEPAVPKYVADEYGVTSLADLDENAQKFNREFLGIEPGTPGNNSIQEAIDADAYGLGDWNLVESSTPAMLAEVDKRTQDEQPVVFLAWAPHWMNIEWDLVYLDDPEEAWPGAGEVRSVSREGFKDDNPNAARFLSRIEVDRETASDWVYQVSQEDRSPADVAREWISQNPDRVGEWLKGVETVEGDPAEAPA